MRVSFVHGAGVRDLAESLQDVSSGLERGADRADLSKPRTWLDLQQVDYGKVLDEQPTPSARSEEDQDPGMTPVAEYTTCSCCRPGLGYAVYGAVVQALGTPLSVAQRLIDWRFPDVAKYSRLEGARGKVIARVAEQLREQNPTALIAHSLGTVVAVDALRELSPDQHPRLLITAGSPLAREGLFETDPTWVQDSNILWINLLDVTDEVTGGVDLDGYRWVGAVNVRVNNDRFSGFFGPDGGWSATHHIKHYMTHPASVETLDYLERTPEAGRDELKHHFLSSLRKPRRA